MQILTAFRVLVNFLKSRDGGNIQAQNIITYTEEFGLDDLDLVYKKYLDLIIDSLAIPTKSKLLISGDTTLDWTDGFATDEDGIPTLSTWSEKYGDLPTIQCWIDLGSNVYVLNSLPITHDTINGTLTIEATGLTDVKIIIS
jgi:hypothetical protein